MLKVIQLTEDFLESEKNIGFGKSLIWLRRNISMNQEKNKILLKN